MTVTQAQFVEMTRPCKKMYEIVVRRNSQRAKACLMALNSITAEFTPEQRDKHNNSLKPALEYFARYGKLSGSPSKYLVGEGGYGRLYIKQGKSYIGLPKNVRHFLAHDLYSDHDIVNCHPVLARQLMDLFNVNGSAMDDWNANRESYFQTLMQASCRTIDRDDCKKVGFVFMYQGDLDFTFQELGIVDTKAAHVADVARRCMDAMVGLCNAIEKSYPVLWDSLPFDPEKANPRAGKFSSLMQHLERHIMLICAYVAKTKFSYEIGDHCHDGLFLSLNGRPVENPDAFHKAAEAAVLAETGFSVSLVGKPMEMPSWGRPLLAHEKPEPNEVVKQGETYDQALAKFNEKHCKISLENCWIYEVDRFKHKILSSQEMKHQAAEIIYLEEHVGKNNEIYHIEKALVESKEFARDSNKRIKEEMGTFPPPLVAPESLYNLWKPFAADTEESYTEKTEGLQIVRDHIKILCANDQAIADYMERWIGHMLVYPAQKSIMINLISNEGAGKGAFISFCERLLGQKRVLDTSEPERDVWGEFNGLMANAFLVVLNEVDKIQTSRGQDKLKHLITDSQMCINLKGGVKYETQSYHRFMLCTNSKDPMPTDKHDRRNLIIRCSDEKIGDKVYFKKFFETISDQDVIHTCYNYFTSLQGLDEFISEPLPVTEYHRELKDSNMSYCAQWVRDLVSESTEKTVKEYKASELLTLFQEWSAGRNLDCKLTSIKFGLALKHSELPGITKRMSNGVHYKLDFPVLQTFFGFDCQV